MTSSRLTTTDWSWRRIMAKLPVNPSLRAAASVRQRLGGRNRVNLLHASSAAGHALVHWSRSDSSEGPTAGGAVFIGYLSATRMIECVSCEVSASVVELAAALVKSPMPADSM